MAGGKLTPRQKMINMMYLVLTALLALNVTKEVINAFVTINESVELSKQNVDKKNANTYAAFSQAMSVDAAKYTKVNDQAQQIKKESDNIVSFIEGLKADLIRKADDLKPTEPVPALIDMESKENYDIPTHMMCGDDQQGRGALATDLKNKLDKYKKLILANVPKGTEADYQKRLETLMNLEDPKKAEDGKRTWEMMNFYHNPVVATVALLTKFENDVRNGESQVIDDLFNSVGKFDFRPDRLQAKIIPNSTVVTNGSNYEAEVFLGATSSTLAPEVFIGATWDSVSKTCKGCEGTPLPTVGGYSKFTQASSGEGERKWGGVIRVKKGDGSIEGYPFNASYVAQKPNSVVAADKMNVLYIGVDNPMSISVPGVSNDKVKVTIDGAGSTLKANPAAGGGHFIATVSTIGAANVKVSAEIGGKVIPMGSFPYRVKRVPDPVATIAKLKGGPINKNVLTAGTLIPILENFDFELFFRITEFKMTIVQKGQDLLEFTTTGSQLSQQMRDALAKGRPGAKIYFEYIKARMDKGDPSTRSLPPMSFVLQ